MIKSYISRVVDGKNLSLEEAQDVVELFSSGEATESQIGALLIALKLKGETVDELTGFALAMRNRAVQVIYKDNNLYDCCGTGGDLSSTINVSTATAILASSMGLYMAKHSNKSVTGNSGSSDVLTELGIKLCDNKQDVINSLDLHKIAFLHAPYFHKSTHSIAKIRKEIGVRTIYNFLGPLTNPAYPVGQLIGVSRPEFCPIIIETVRNLGIKSAMVVCAMNPVMDEISICGETIIYRLNDGKIIKEEVSPEQFSIKRVSLEELKGYNPQYNARIIKEILENKLADCKRDIILVNMAALLMVSGRAENLTEGINLAREAIESGLGADKLIRLQHHV